MAKSSTISSDNFDEFNTQLQGAALKATRNALAIPADVNFHRTVDPQVARDMDRISSRVLSLTNDILAFVSAADSAKLIRNQGKSKLNDLTDAVDNFTSIVVDPVDLLFERADICLDEYLGRRKPPAIDINVKNPPEANPNPKKQNGHQGWLDPALKHASHLPKPQLSFKRKPNNTSGLQWYPPILHKYNAQVPLGYNLHDEDIEIDAEQLRKTHHYRYEIEHIEYPAWMFHATPPIPPKPFNETPFTWVTTSEEFDAMLGKLRGTREIAIDLEHHSYRTFAGFICLMQISTREQDWIVDALILRDELTELNEVFTNPSIVKVLHGAKSDVLWLQQDFGLYIVNLFDTFHASKVLEFPRHGLANLLEMYCDFTPDKQYQLADWRIRPLPEEMLLYARSDTHFLLYVYDNVRNALLDRGLSLMHVSQETSLSANTIPTSKLNLNDQSHAFIREVLARSEETTLSIYQPQSYDAEGGTGVGGWESLLRKWNKSTLIEGPQRNLFLGVHAWRDRVAREEDESIRYVLPDHSLLRLIDHPPLDIGSLNSLFHYVPPIVRKRAQELLNVIRENVNASGESVDPAITVSGVAANATTTTPAEEMQIEVPDINSDTLWSKRDAISTNSSLFGSTLTVTSSKSSTLYSISESALFGSRKGSVQSKVTVMSTPNGSSFRDVVAKIHSTLVVAPSAPKILSQAAQRKVTDVEADAVAPPSDDPVEPPADEIPFVSASQRRTRAVVDDSIVVVGQKKQKKRKRPKTSPPQNADLSSTADVLSVVGSRTDGEKNVEKMINADDLHDATPQEPFGFSSVPNILDNVPIAEEGLNRRGKKKQKRQDGGVFEYGDFPAPPRAHRETRSGNQSHTFK